MPSLFAPYALAILALLSVAIVFSEVIARKKRHDHKHF